MGGGVTHRGPLGAVSHAWNPKGLAQCPACLQRAVEGDQGCGHSPRCPRPRGPPGWAGCLGAGAQASLGPAAVLGSLGVSTDPPTPAVGKGAGPDSTRGRSCPALAWPGPPHTDPAAQRPPVATAPHPICPGTPSLRVLAWEAQGSHHFADLRLRPCPRSGNGGRGLRAAQGHVALMPYQAQHGQWAGVASPWAPGPVASTGGLCSGSCIRGNHTHLYPHTRTRMHTHTPVCTQAPPPWHSRESGR